MKKVLIILLLSVTPVTVFAQEKTPIEVTADNALEWDRANRTFTATGNALIVQGDSSIAAPNLTAFYDEGDSIVIRQVVAKPNATLKQPNETLTAKTVTADFNNGILSVVTATDNVVIKTDTETLYGDKAVYEADKSIVTVTGNVRIEQDQNILTGNKATFDMNTNISTMTATPESGGRVKATFYSEASE